MCTKGQDICKKKQKTLLNNVRPAPNKRRSVTKNKKTY